jgi:hypothetical protein
MRVLFSFLIAPILYCCSDTNKKAQVEKKIVYPQIENAKKLSIRKVGELRFRRSYADIQFREMSDAELEQIRRSNPSPDFFNDSTLVKKFQKIGLLNGKEELLLRKFDSYKVYDYDHRSALFILTDSIENKITVEICYKGGYANFDLCVGDGQQNSEIEIDGAYFEGLKYMLLDIVERGYKEIVILNNYYIMNGDNSDLLIYEIKYN